MTLPLGATAMEHEVIRLISQRFDTFESSVSNRFDSVDNRLSDLTLQVRETNGQVRKHDAHIAGCSPMIDRLKEELLVVKAEEQIKESDVKTGENRRITVWDVLILVSTVGITYAALKELGHIK